MLITTSKVGATAGFIVVELAALTAGVDPMSALPRAGVGLVIGALAGALLGWFFASLTCRPGRDEVAAPPEVPEL